MTIQLQPQHDALLVVDLQPDFFPGGSLPVPGAHDIVPPLVRLVERRLFETVVATQDWHPPGHRSFASSHPGAEPFQTRELHGYAQTLWPDHAVQGTPGAELHLALPREPLTLILRKGQDQQVDSYSAFRDNPGPGGTRRETGLSGYLRARGVKRVFLAGLALDFCVAWTALDAISSDFNTVVLRDLTRSVRLEGERETWKQLAAAGVTIETSRQLLSPS